MALVTTRNNGLVGQKKPFTWSYSRLKNFKVCPKRHYEVDIEKRIKEAESEQLTWGNAVHAALANRCGPQRTPLPAGMPYEHWAASVLSNADSSQILVEQNLALKADFTSCGYFDDGVWYRAKGDLIKITGNVALVVDWKTGRILEDSQQLALSAACIFAKFPQVDAVRCTFVWLKEDAESSENFYRADMPRMWRGIWPDIEQLKAAYDNTNYPPNPSRMCRSWCPVTSCPHHGKSY